MENELFRVISEEKVFSIVAGCVVIGHFVSRKHMIFLASAYLVEGNKLKDYQQHWKNISENFVCEYSWDKSRLLQNIDRVGHYLKD